MKWEIIYTNFKTGRDVCNVESSSDTEALKDFYRTHPASTMLSIATTPYHGKEIIGYTMSGGYCLCCKHARYGQVRDDGNETGFCYPIFSTDESFDACCDVCQEVISEEYIEPETEEDDTEDMPIDDIEPANELTAILDNNNVPYNLLKNQQVSTLRGYITIDVYSIVANTGLICSKGLCYAVELIGNLWIIRTKQIGE